MQTIYREILADPRYRALTRKRSRIALTLAAIVIANATWYTLATAFYPHAAFARFWGETLGPGYTTTWGIVIGFLQTVLFVALVGYYVYRSNTEFEAATAAIVADAMRRAQSR